MAYNVTRLLDLETPEDQLVAEAAAMAVVAFERLFVDLLGQRAAEGLLRDHTATSSLNCVVNELLARQRRPSGFMGPSEDLEQRVPGPLLPLPEPAILIDDDDQDPFL